MVVPIAYSAASAADLEAIQINKFKRGGLAIGLRNSHRIADRITISTFINAWATTFREGGISDQVPRPRFYCSFLFPQRDLRLNLPPAPKVHSKIVTKVFVINKEAIDNLKSKICGGSDSGVKYHPSRLKVVTTLVWKALIGSAKAQRGHLRASSLLQIMTLRGKVSMPLPENACGNMYKPFISRFNTYDKNNKLELTVIVSLLRDAKRKAISD
ncbi:PREDICTED: acetyl-CoA-benzylalcohol acetyltransferase-like [Populus euphratica]|uniref:Acetyl-CoA-benzylalcohol acetyltransferase-like n=1 Tax=Populus euphratica TaxID=75702 RepID=A0AAJ6UYK8_POPEU|nr:PREDICTED: acetyl-CoA-benzylalcohol acetyltransferase-like [Populus euphratica]